VKKLEILRRSSEVGGGFVIKEVKQGSWSLAEKIRNGKAICLGNDESKVVTVKPALEFDENGRLVRRW